MKRNILIAIFGFAMLFTIGLKTVLATNNESGGYDAVTYDDAISFSATLNANGDVLTAWSKYSHAEGFSFYKVVRSTTNNNPVYPDDGYIYYTGNLDELSYTDNDVPEGTVYYRVCQIASPKRYCSKTVTITGAEAVTEEETEVQSTQDSSEEESENAEVAETEDSVTDAVITGDAERSESVKSEENNGDFSDLNDSHWVHGCVKRLSDDGIVSGHPDGSFRPNNPINRAEFLKLVFIALYPELSNSNASSCFSDVKSDDWFSGYVCAALSKNIVTGYDGNTFKPSQPITRAEAVSMLIKSLGLPISADVSSSFKDVTVVWQKAYVNSASKYGLVNGYADKTFRPNNNIVRAEAAQVVCNALDGQFPEEDLVKDDGYYSEQMEAMTKIEKVTDAVIIDHRNTDLSKIPASYIENAKQMFRITYGHTSHGSQITTGMQGLKGTSGSTYYFSSDGSGGLYYNEGLMSGDLGTNGDLTWEKETRDMLANHEDINLVMWSWCGGVSGNSAEDTSTYLNAMNQLEEDFPNVTFVYMTGHLDGTGVDGNLNQRNEQIRNYVRTHNKVLFDFADIESYDPNGTYFLDNDATDGNDYDGNSNWAANWCSANPGSDLCAVNSCAHSTSLNCNLKGRAFWWMMARLAGWEGN
jgi:hypothetical protein